MTNTDFITPDKFVAAWRTVWLGMLKSERADVVKKFCGKSKPWTDYMLTGENSFLPRLGRQLLGENAEVVRESYGMVDICFVANNNRGYPERIDVMVEHENQSNVENEMWKLIFLRSPLKVVVFYHHSPEDKLEQCWEMLMRANEQFPENPDTRYLFIVGNVVDNELHWRWASDQKHKLCKICV